MPTLKSRKEVSTTESYAFVLHSLGPPLLILYTLWALVPESILHSWGITYYPPKAVALYLPTALMGLFLATPVVYFLMNCASAPGVESLDTIWDGHSRQRNVSPCKNGADGLESKKSAGIGYSRMKPEVPEIYDMDVFEVNRLFLKQ